ncbi:MAG: helix-turn-helix domain-containing protein [Solirubrobacteraceae bacterium]
MANTEIAQRLAVSRQAVSLWRIRFCAEGVQGLEERPRPGRPRRFSPRRRSPRSRRWRARCRPSRACRCRVGRRLSSRSKRSSAGSSRRSPP